jgi:ABC-type dipeptide transport system, periplasmic component
MAKNRKRAISTSLNKLRRHADKIERAATKQHRNFFNGRLGIAKEMRFDVGIWLGLITLLIFALILQGIFYQTNNTTTTSRRGGSYAEGIVGEIVSFNPLFAENGDEKALSSLVYSSLLKTDETNNIANDLASSWTVSNDGLNYDVKLREDAFWHGSDKPVTAADVVFTTQLIKDPKVQSSLYETWKNIEVSRLSENEVRFTLRTSLALFPWALNFGILSSDELQNINRDEIREYLSDQAAIGSGPFVFRNVSLSGSKNNILYFTPNTTYFNGAPQIEALHIETYSDDQKMIDGFRNGEINLANGISIKTANENISDDLYSTPVNSGVFAIFNTDGEITNSSTVRQALRLALDRDKVRSIASVGKYTPNILETPIAPGIFDQVDTLRQPVDNNVEAKRLLNADGWQYDIRQKLAKDLSPLKLNIVTVKDSDYVQTAEEIARQWKEIGVESEIILASAENIQQNFIMPRNYDVLVYRLELGGDGDVYSYWHSSGAKEQGLNLANYKSATADVALARARTQLDQDTRGSIYKDFAESWINDVPAIALYQANLYYLKSKNVQAWRGDSLTDKSVRFRNVNNFTVNAAQVNKTP